MLKLLPQDTQPGKWAQGAAVSFSRIENKRTLSGPFLYLFDLALLCFHNAMVTVVRMKKKGCPAENTEVREVSDAIPLYRTALLIRQKSY